MAVQHELGQAGDAPEQASTERELVGEGERHPVGETLREGLDGRRQHVVVQEHDAQRPRRGARERLGAGVDHALAHRAVASDEEAVVRRGRVHAHEVQAGAAHDVDASCLLHDERTHVVAEAVVVAGHDGHAPGVEQRGEGVEEERVLGGATAMGDVAGDHDVIDLARDQLLAEARGDPTLRLAASEVEVREVCESLALHVTEARRPRKSAAVAGEKPG